MGDVVNSINSLFSSYSKWISDGSANGVLSFDHGYRSFTCGGGGTTFNRIHWQRPSPSVSLYNDSMI